MREQTTGMLEVILDENKGLREKLRASQEEIESLKFKLFKLELPHLKTMVVPPPFPSGYEVSEEKVRINTAPPFNLTEETVAKEIESMNPLRGCISDWSNL